MSGDELEDGMEDLDGFEDDDDELDLVFDIDEDEEGFSSLLKFVKYEYFVEDDEIDEYECKFGIKGKKFLFKVFKDDGFDDIMGEFVGDDDDSVSEEDESV